MTSSLLRFRGILALAGWIAAANTAAIAQQSADNPTVAVAEEAGGDQTPAKKSSQFVHPLAWTIDFANSRSEYIQTSVRDYTCRLIKRERIDGELQPYQLARLKVRSEQRVDGEVVKPMAVFMQFLGPSRLKDRRVLYIDGQNDGQALVRKGGGVLKNLQLSVNPHGNAAKRESNYPITDVGFDKVVERLIELANDDIARDPRGENTKVSYFRDAKVGNRKCMHIRVIHPEESEGMQFHIASLYVDNELQLPTKLAVYGWPERAGEQPPINEEYNYVDLRLNVGLADADFSETKLE
jgi:hypothetical protein